MARRSKASEALIDTLLLALGTGITREAACSHAQIHRTTLYRWLAADPALRVRVEKAEADFEVRLAAQIVQEAAEDWRAAAWMLERRRPASYGRAQANAASVAALSEATALAPHPLDDLGPDEAARRATEWASILTAEAAGVAARSRAGVGAG